METEIEAGGQALTNEELNELPKKGKKGLAKGMGWTTLSTFWGASSNFISVVVLSHILDASQTGYAQAAVVLIAFAQLLSQGGLAGALIQHQKATRVHFGTAFIASLGWGLLQTAIVYVFADQLATLFGMPGVAPLFRLASVVFAISAISRVSTSYMARDLQLQRVAKSEIAGSLANLGIAVGLAYAGFGAAAPVWASVAQSITLAAMAMYWAPPPFPLVFDRTALKELLPHARGFSSSLLLNFTANRMDNVIVGRMLDAAALGIYARAYNLTARPAIAVSMSIYKALFPAMARLQDDHGELKKLYSNALAFVSLLLLPLSVVLAVLGKETVLVVLGKHWGPAIVPFQIMSVCMYFRAVSEVSTGVARAVGAPKDQVIPKVIYAVCVVVGAIIGCRWGIVAVSAFVLLANAIHYYAVSVVCLERLKLSWSEFMSHQWAPILVSCATAATAYAVAFPMRAAKMPNAAVLAVGLSVSALCWVGIIALFKRQILGEEGSAMLQKASRKILKRDGTKA